MYIIYRHFFSLPINMCLWWSRLLPIVTVFVYYYYCLAFLAFWLEDVFCSFDHRNVPCPQLTFLAKFFLLHLLYRGVDERELSSWSGLSGWSVTLDINPGPWKLGTATGSFNPGLHPGQPFISPGHTHTHSSSYCFWHTLINVNINVCKDFIPTDSVLNL